jgi:hypothetical protein
MVMPATSLATVTAIRSATAAALGLWLAARAPAQDYVTVPNVYATSSGGGASAILIAPQNNPWTVQLLWNPNQLTGLAPGSQITGVTYRLNAVVPNGYPLQTTTWADYRISLGPSVLPSQATATFADNFLAPPTLVRSSTLTAAPFAWPTGGGGPPNANPWGVEIPFDTPYVYTGGPLALLVTHPGSNNPSFGNALLDATFSGSPGQGTDFTMIAGTGFNATTGASSVFSTIVRLTVVPVPEPAHLGLLVAAVPLASLAWRKRR